MRLRLARFGKPSEVNMERLLSWKELRLSIPYSRQHIARLEKAGLFPQRVEVGARRVAWRSSEISEWIAARERVKGSG